MEIGEVVDCAHCGAPHHPDKGFCHAGNPKSSYGSCILCLKSAGLDYEKHDRMKVICSICSGKGKVWIGTNASTIQIHQTIATLSDRLDERIGELLDQVGTLDSNQFDLLIERLDKIIELLNSVQNENANLVA